MADLGETFIAGFVTVVIVVSLEMVDIEERQRYRLTIANGEVTFALQRLLKGTEVAEAGECISGSQPFEFIACPSQRRFQFLSLGESCGDRHAHEHRDA